MKIVDENETMEVTYTDIHNIIINGTMNDYVFKIPESLSIRIPEDIQAKDRGLPVYLILSLLGYKPEVKERFGRGDS